MENKLFGYLGIAARARKIAIGESCYKAITSKKAKLVLLASDASDKTQKRVQVTCNSCNVPLINDFSSAMISHSIGQVNRMMVAVLDDGLAKQMLNCKK